MLELQLRRIMNILSETQCFLCGAYTIQVPFRFGFWYLLGRENNVLSLKGVEREKFVLSIRSR